jgi:hypothetical protein
VVTPTLNQTHDDRLCSLRGPFGDRDGTADHELKSSDPKRKIRKLVHHGKGHQLGVHRDPRSASDPSVSVVRCSGRRAEWLLSMLSEHELDERAQRRLARHRLDSQLPSESARRQVPTVSKADVHALSLDS